MAIEAISAWLNGSRQYTLGVELYKEYGNNAVLLQLFIKGPATSFLKQKLEKELEALNKNATSSEQAQPQRILYTSGNNVEYLRSSDGKHKVAYTDCPKEILNRLSEAGVIKRKIALLHNELELTPEGVELAEKTSQIAQLSYQYRTIWYSLEHYIVTREIIDIAHDVKPVKKVRYNMNKLGDLYRLKKNLEANISKAKKKEKLHLLLKHTNKLNEVLKQIDILNRE